MYYRIGAYGWSGERNTNRGEQPWLQLKCTGVDVQRGGGVEVVPHSPSVRTEMEFNTCVHENT